MKYDDVEITVEKSTYYNGNLCIIMNTEEGETYAILTKNFQEELDPYLAYVDTNNLPGIMDFIEKNKLGKFTGLYRESGFCKYPLFVFDLEVIKNV